MKEDSVILNPHRVGVIVLNYNDAIGTERCCRRLLSDSNIYRIVVVDNCSPDNSYEEIQRMFSGESRIKVIKESENRGYASGNNYGAEFMHNHFPEVDLYIFSNTDILVNSKTVTHLMRVCLELDSMNIQYGMIAPAVGVDGSTGLNSGKRLPTYTDDILSLLVPFSKRRKKRDCMDGKLQLQSWHLIPTEVVSGAFFLIAAASFFEVDGFDNRTFLYGEERILGFKLKKRKYSSFLVPNISVHHEGSASINRVLNPRSRFKTLYESRKIYLQNYVRVGKVRLIVYDVLSKVSLLQISILFDLKRILKIGERKQK